MVQAGTQVYTQRWLKGIAGMREGGRCVGGCVAPVRYACARRHTRAHTHAPTYAYTYVRTRARHGKHQINHLINFAEVVVVMVMVAAVMVVVNSKRLVRYFAVTSTSIVNDG